MTPKSQPEEASPAPGPAEPTKRGTWFARHKFLTFLGALVVLIVAIAIGSGGGDDPAPAAGPTASAPAEGDEPTAADEPTDDPTPDEEPSPEEPADALAERYPVFDIVEQSGTGDSIVAVPAAAAMVTMTHDGSANFAVMVLDAANESTGDLLANEIGAYTGTAAFGLTAIAGEPANLQITADGNWTITIAPLSSAPALPESGTGDGVFRYDGGAAAWNLTHDGAGNFAVMQHTDDLLGTKLLVNEIGAYTGTVPASAGPSIVTVMADGNWTITSQ